MIVCDSSIVASALLSSGDHAHWASSTLVGSGPSHGLLAPELMYAEVTNIVRRAEASLEISRDVASLAYEELMQLPVQAVPFAPFAGRVWELRGNVTPCDAWYVAVAEAFEIPFATLDERLAAAPGPRCTFLIPPIDRPQ